MKTLTIPPLPIQPGDSAPRWNWSRFFRVDERLRKMFWDGEPIRGDDNLEIVVTLECNLLSIPEHAFARTVQYLARTHMSSDTKIFLPGFMEGKCQVVFKGVVYDFHHDYEMWEFSGFRLMPARQQISALC